MAMYFQILLNFVQSQSQEFLKYQLLASFFMKFIIHSPFHELTIQNVIKHHNENKYMIITEFFLILA